MIAKAVKISLAPLEAGVWGYDQIKEWLSIRVTRILSDRKANILKHIQIKLLTRAPLGSLRVMGFE